ncbi:MAG: hypothetical protein NZ518_03565 [Dehalococcoidia bacterium]|nr:hypothetical protein [Dehalococcoidia bacterium]
MTHVARAVGIGLGLWATQFALAWLSPAGSPFSWWSVAASFMALTVVGMLAAVGQFDARRPSIRLAIRVGCLWLTLSVLGNLAVERWDLAPMATQEYLARNTAAPVAFVVGPVAWAIARWPRWGASSASAPRVPAKLGR